MLIASSLLWLMEGGTTTLPHREQHCTISQYYAASEQISWSFTGRPVGYTTETLVMSRGGGGDLASSLKNLYH